jgi:hypothetical protein
MIEKPDDQKICEGCLTPLTPFNSENSAYHWSEEWDVCDDCYPDLEAGALSDEKAAYIESRE